MVDKRDFVVEILRQSGLVTAKYIEEAMAYGEEEGKGLLDSLIELKYVTEFDVYKTLAKHFGMEIVTLSGLDIPEEIINLIPEETAKKYSVIPIKKDQDFLTIAISNPLDLEIIDTLKFLLKSDIETVVASPSDLEEAIGRYYLKSDMSRQQAVDELMVQVEQSGINVDGVTFVKGDDDNESAEDDAPIIKLVGLIITEAFRMRASDIHIEPLERKLRVRYRIDGILEEVDSPPKRLQGSILSRVKIMAKLKISEKRLPQDGRIKLTIGDKPIDLRVSTIPTNTGESVVMRILDKSSLMLGLPQLGFLTEDEEKFRDIVGLPNGIILITGPTGSGKTTTLYSCLNFLNRPDRKIITVEDPIEYQLPGINQVQVLEQIGLTFAAVLRSMLRQAPNIIMVGEIRDLETAEIAVNAALTGHLVFSTLHTNDAAGAFTRLIDQGVKPFLAASSVQGVLAQRLVRCVCDKCRKPYNPNDAELESVGLSRDNLKDAKIAKGEGCDFCSGSGYKGRKGLFELIEVNDEIRNLVYKGVSADVIKMQAREYGMKTLIEDGRLKVLNGMTTIEEVLRVSSED